MGMGAFFLSIISNDLFSKKNSSYDSNYFFHIGMEAWGGEQLFVFLSFFKLNSFVGAGKWRQECLGTDFIFVGVRL